MADVRSTISGDDPQDFQSHARTTPAIMGGSAPVVVPPELLGSTVARNGHSAARDRGEVDRLTRLVTVLGSGVVPASGPLVLDCGAPSEGHVWDVKRLIVGPASFLVTPYATGVTVIAFARLGVAAGNPDVGATNVLSWTNQWPAQAYWGWHQATIDGGDHLQVAVLGLPAGTTVTVGGAAEDSLAAVPYVRSL